MKRPQFVYIHESHLDLFWIGDYRYCLERGRHVIKQYLDRCMAYPDEAFLLETVVFLEYFLDRHPEYEPIVQKLWHGGQLDIGAAYVDILEHLALGESQIRNIARGKAWCREHLGIDTRLAAHADLPSLIPQAGQIYTQAQVPYYATSRKIFPNGAVWVHQSPDGTGMMVFNHPFHYDFHRLKEHAEAFNEGRGWDKYIDPAEIVKGFPLGKLVLSAGAADQADLQCFENKYGKPARAFVEEYKATFPDIDFSFGTVTPMMDEYQAIRDELPHLQGEIPSVWGMTSVPSTFFQRGRRLEGTLLTAELLAWLGRWHAFTPIADLRDEWYGTLYERLYFLDKAPIPRGGELDELWKMHLFVYDHNFSGNHAPQTAFDKRTIQERALSYAEEMVRHGLRRLAGAPEAKERLLVFNPLNWTRYEPVEVTVPRQWLGPGAGLSDSNGDAVSWQQLDGGVETAETVPIVIAPTVPSVGYTMVGPGGDGPNPGPEAVAYDDGRTITVHTGRLCVQVDKRTAVLTCLKDKTTGADWGSDRVNALYAVYEQKFDVPLGVDESQVLGREVVHSVELSAVGPLFAKITLIKSLLKAYVRQEIIVWRRSIDAVDIKTTVLWHGQRRVQMRQCLPTTARREDVFYGTPFYGNNWLNVVPGSGPRNPDEMANMAHWYDYRELQLWVHQKREEGALSMASLHPTYHWGKDGLEAVLMRTTPSGADDRFFWEHSGQREYAFRFHLTDARASLSIPTRLGYQAMRPLIGQLVSGDGTVDIPAGRPLIQLEDEHLILSAVHPDEQTGGAIVRFFESGGRHVTAHIRVPSANQLARVNLLGETIEELSATEGSATVEVKPYEIVTLRAMR